MIKRGMVLEVNNGKVGIMTTEGEFFYVVKNHILPELGDEYEGRLYKSKTYLNFRPSVFLTAASILLIFNTLLGYNLFFSVYDTYEVNINPSIKLYTNRIGKIIKTEGLNQDGIIVLSNINVKNKDIESGLEAIVDEAKELNYLNENNYNVSIIDSKNENRNFSKLNEKISKYQEEFKNKKEAIMETNENSIYKVDEESTNIDNIKDSNDNNSKDINNVDNNKNTDSNTTSNNNNSKTKDTSNSSSNANKNIKEKDNNKLKENNYKNNKEQDNNSKKDSNNNLNNGNNKQQNINEHKK